MNFSTKPSIFAIVGLLFSAQISWAQLVIANPGEPIQSFAHPLNLVVTNKLHCIELEQVKNNYTPADLAVAVSKCIRGSRYDDATQLFFVYSAYGHFDKLRVVDRSAGAAIGMLNLQIGSKLKVGKNQGF